MEDQIREFQERINEVMSERSQFGGAFFEFEKQIKELANETARMKTQLTHKLNARKDEMESKEQLFKNLKEAETLLQCHNASYAKFEAECSVTIEENQKTNDMVQSTINLVQTLTTGLSASEGQDNGYIDKLNSIMN